MEAAQGRAVKVFFGSDDVVRRLVNLPDEEQLQPQLSSRYIRKEIAVLRRRGSDGSGPTPATEQASLEIGDGRLMIQRADVVNIYVAGPPDANGGVWLPDDGDPVVKRDARVGRRILPGRYSRVSGSNGLSSAYEGVACGRF